MEKNKTDPADREIDKSIKSLPPEMREKVKMKKLSDENTMRILVTALLDRRDMKALKSRKDKNDLFTNMLPDIYGDALVFSQYSDDAVRKDLAKKKNDLNLEGLFSVKFMFAGHFIPERCMVIDITSGKKTDLPVIPMNRVMFLDIPMGYFNYSHVVVISRKDFRSAALEKMVQKYRKRYSAVKGEVDAERAREQEKEKEKAKEREKMKSPEKPQEKEGDMRKEPDKGKAPQ